MALYRWYGRQRDGKWSRTRDNPQVRTSPWDNGHCRQAPRSALHTWHIPSAYNPFDTEVVGTPGGTWQDKQDRRTAICIGDDTRPHQAVFFSAIESLLGLGKPWENWWENWWEQASLGIELGQVWETGWEQVWGTRWETGWEQVSVGNCQSPP